MLVIAVDWAVQTACATVTRFLSSTNLTENPSHTFFNISLVRHTSSGCDFIPGSIMTLKELDPAIKNSKRLLRFVYSVIKRLG